MYESLGIDRDADVRRARFGCVEEEQIAGLTIGEVHTRSARELPDDRSRNLNPLGAEHVPHEAAAIESDLRCFAAKPVRRSSQRESPIHDGRCRRERPDVMPNPRAGER